MTEPIDQRHEELDSRRERALQLGGAQALLLQRERGKLNARERIARFVDADSFHEMGMLAGKGGYDADGVFQSFTPSNAIIGTGRVQGRRLALSVDDFTIRGGSSESTVSDKWVYAERYAHEMQLPLVRFVDTAGGSVKLLEQQQSTKIPGYASWPSISLLSKVPVVGVALGACAGLGAIKVAASHFSVMVKGASQVFAGGPPVVKQGIGIDIDKESLGGWELHIRHSGVVNNVAATEDDAFEQARRFLSYLPSNVFGVAAGRAARPAGSGQDRMARRGHPREPATGL